MLTGDFSVVGTLHCSQLIISKLMYSQQLHANERLLISLLLTGSLLIFHQTNEVPHKHEQTHLYEVKITGVVVYSFFETLTYFLSDLFEVFFPSYKQKGAQQGRRNSLPQCHDSLYGHFIYFNNKATGWKLVLSSHFHIAHTG